MKRLVTMALMTVGGLLIACGMSARTQESTTVEVPFEFSVGTQMLPAGTYKIELTTQAEVGKDPIEVVVFHGQDPHAYASFVSRVLDDPAPTSGLTFQRAQGQEFLTEIRARGRRLEPSARAGETRTGTAEAAHELLAD